MRKILPLLAVGAVLVLGAATGCALLALLPHEPPAWAVAATQEAVHATATAQAVQAAQVAADQALWGPWVVGGFVLLLLLAGVAGWRAIGHEQAVEVLTLDYADAQDARDGAYIEVDGVLLPRTLLDDPAVALELARISAARAVGVARGSRPPPAHYAPHYAPAWHGAAPALPPGNGAQEPPVSPLIAPLTLPGVTELGDVLAGGWTPTAQSILLGLGPGGARITVPAGDALCHIVFAGPTGVGKTNLMRLFLTQLLAAGCRVALLDPHFTPTNPDTGEDWRAIAARVGEGRGPLVDKGAILAALERLAHEELPRRLTAWNAGQGKGAATFIAIEEAPALADYDRRFMEYVRPLLREGRKLNLFVIMAAQDVLVSSLGTSSGVRAQFQTCYYGGGDPASARALLGQTPPDPPGAPGVVWLRARPCREPALVRVPLVRNETIQQLLRLPVVAAPVASPVVSAVVSAAPDDRPLTTETTGPVGVQTTATTADDRAIVTAFLGGKSIPQIIDDRWGVKPNSTRYPALSSQVQEALRRGLAKE